LIIAAGMLLCVLLFIWQFLRAGPRIRIAFEQAYGLERHDPIRLRGIDVGWIEDIRLAADADHVLVDARIQAEYRHLAVAGTRFWIVHPHVAWERITGLDTIVGTRYLTCDPGSGAPAREFVGLEQAPALIPADALTLRFNAPDRRGLTIGAAILHRGMPIGRLNSAALANDARGVAAEGYIDGPYRFLVHANSRFCPAQTLQLKGGLTGISIDMPSLSELTLGGLVLVNDPIPAGEVEPNTVFHVEDSRLLDKQDEQGPVRMGRSADSLPTTLPVRLHWIVPRRFWSDGERQRQGTGIVFEDGILLPAALVQAPAGSEQVRLQIGDAQSVGMPTELTVVDGFVWQPLAGQPVKTVPWRQPGQPESVLIAIAEDRAQPVAPGSVLVASDGWHLRPGYPVSGLQAGQPVLAVEDGALVAVVAAEPWRLVPVTDLADLRATVLAEE